MHSTVQYELFSLAPFCVYFYWQDEARVRGRKEWSNKRKNVCMYVSEFACACVRMCVEYKRKKMLRKELQHNARLWFEKREAMHRFLIDQGPFFLLSIRTIDSRSLCQNKVNSIVSRMMYGIMMISKANG